MFIVIWILRIFIIIGCIRFLSKLIKAKRIDKSLILNFSIIPLMEVSFLIGFIIVSVFSNINIGFHYLFILTILVFSLIFIFVDSKRIIFIGDKQMFIHMDLVKYSDIVEIKSNLVKMDFITKEKRYRVWMPLLKFDNLREKLLKNRK